MSEVPPTAGLPLRWRDFMGGYENLGETLARLLGTPPLQYECSGTVCLLVALLTLRRRQPGRDRVIVPAYTCPLVALAIHHAGLQVLACDIRAGHFDLDSDHLATLLDERTLAVLPTHLGGRLADIDGVISVARKFGASVIEDAAQALGANQYGRSVGLAGDAGFFSLAAGKGLTTYEGGLLLTRDEQLREEFAWTSTQLVGSQPLWELRRCMEYLGYWIFYRPSLLGVAYGWPRRRALERADPIAAVGDRFRNEFPRHRAGRWRGSVAAHASKRLPAFLESCSGQARQRLERLQQIEALHVLRDPPGRDTGTWPILMILMADQASRDRVLQRLWRSPLGVTRLFIHALPDYPELAGHFVDTDVPNARDLASRMVTISNSPWLSDEDFEQIVSVLTDVADTAV